MAKADDPRITYRAPAALRKKLKIKAAQKDKSVQSIIDEALKQYFRPIPGNHDIDIVSGSFAQSRAVSPVEQTDLDLLITEYPDDIIIKVKNADHQRILSAVEMLLNDREACPVHRPILEALIAPELEKYDAEHEEPDGDDGEEGAA